MHRLILVSLTALLALSACVSPKTAEVPAPPPAPAPPPTATPAPEALGWQDRPLTPGDWRYRSEANATIAIYGQLSQPADLTVRCDKGTRRVSFGRLGVLDAGRSAKMTLRGTEGAGSYVSTNLGGTPPQVGASLSAADTALDRLIYSRGRILVQIDGAPDIVVPSWAELARVVEDCRG